MEINWEHLSNCHVLTLDPNPDISDTPCFATRDTRYQSQTNVLPRYKRRCSGRKKFSLTHRLHFVT